jgi:prolyl oligopeptidase
MIPKTSILRVARPSDNLAVVSRMYIDGLGFNLLGEFFDHDGFNGAIVGHPKHAYHLEFTQHKGASAGRAPTQDNLLIFYFVDQQEWSRACEKMLSAGFNSVSSYNPYWDEVGRTFEDVDGYRVVLQNREWVL